MSAFVFLSVLLLWLACPLVVLLVVVRAAMRHKTRTLKAGGAARWWGWHARAALRLLWHGADAPAPTTAAKQPHHTTTSATVLPHAQGPLGAIDLPQVLLFGYVDASCKQTQRRVNVDAVGRWQFEGYCYMRKARRTFRYDGVVGDVTVESTGELIAAADMKVVLC